MAKWCHRGIYERIRFQLSDFPYCRTAKATTEHVISQRHLDAIGTIYPASHESPKIQRIWQYIQICHARGLLACCLLYGTRCIIHFFLTWLFPDSSASERQTRRLPNFPVPKEVLDG